MSTTRTSLHLAGRAALLRHQCRRYENGDPLNLVLVGDRADFGGSRSPAVASDRSSGPAALAHCQRLHQGSRYPPISSPISLAGRRT